MRLMSQLFESLKIPIVKPRIVAIITPDTATNSVFRTPTTAARKWVSVGEKGMKGWKVMSYPAVEFKKLKLKSFPTFFKLVATLLTIMPKIANTITIVRI